MIATLTPNPSLDLTYNLSALERGEVQRAGSVSVEAGGKGINVLTGADPVAPVGGAAFHDTRIWIRPA